MLIDQQHAQVVNICAGRPGEDQAVRALERVIKRRYRQHVGDGNALRIQRGFGCAVYITARRVGRPSVPSEPTEKIATFESPAIPSAAASASSWLRPPLPCPVRCTTVSPPRIYAMG